MRTNAMLALIAGLCVAASAKAAPADPTSDRTLSAEYHRCAGPNDGNSAAEQCIEPEFWRQDGRLNEAYRAAMARLAPARQAALRDSERAWVKARQAECNRLYREMEGGTADGLTLDTCMAVRAIERTAWLEHFR
ncbi:MAG TPA: lysozyme inhibitor LprI family protein [Allosphingosinicella sp.]|nr:lysozyme inhibitor LprI family protein [Allosphingosinicella sp.]